MVFESKGLISKYSLIRTYGIPCGASGLVGLRGGVNRVKGKNFSPFHPPFAPEDGRWGTPVCSGFRQRGLARGVSLDASGCQRAMKMEIRLWRRGQFCLGQSDFIFADGAWDVCEGGHSLDVMNPWDALMRKIRCWRFGESRRPSLRDRTIQSSGIRKEREYGHLL